MCQSHVINILSEKSSLNYTFLFSGSLLNYAFRLCGVEGLYGNE